MRGMARFSVLVFCIFLFSGCARVKETTKSFLGVSTQILENCRKDAVKETFQCGYDDCYALALNVLKQMKAYTYSKDKAKGLIAVYVSEEDTTPVGVFFTALDQQRTQLEVCSPSSSAKEYIAMRLFSQIGLKLSFPNEPSSP